MADLQTILKNALARAQWEYGSPYEIARYIPGLSEGGYGEASSDFLGQAFEFAKSRNIPLEQGIVEYAERNKNRFPYVSLALDTMSGKVSGADAKKINEYLRASENALSGIQSLTSRIPDLNVAKRDLAAELAKPVGQAVFNPLIGGYEKNVTDFQRPEVIRDLQDKIARLEATSERAAPLKENLLGLESLYKSIGADVSYVKPVEELMLQFSPENYQAEAQQNFVNQLLGKEKVDWTDELQDIIGRNRETQARQEARILNLGAYEPTLDQLRTALQLGLSDSNLNKPQAFVDEYYSLPSTATASDVQSLLDKYGLPSISELAFRGYGSETQTAYIPGLGGVTRVDPYVSQEGRNWQGFASPGIRIIPESAAESDALARSRIGTEYDIIGRNPELLRDVINYGLTPAPASLARTLTTATSTPVDATSDLISNAAAQAASTNTTGVAPSLFSIPGYSATHGAALSPTAGGRRPGGENIPLMTGLQFLRSDQPNEGFAEGGLARRPFIEDPEFNLGMTPAAFRNLGLMGLPGADMTVANPVVMNQLQSSFSPESRLAKDPFPDKVTTGYIPESLIPEAGMPISQSIQIPSGNAPATTAKDLFDYYATSFNPDQAALDFWNQKIGTLGYEGTLNEFLNPAQGAAAPRAATMFQDPDYLKIAKPTPVVPTKEPTEVIDSGKTVTQTATTAPAAPAVDTSNFPKFEGKPYDPAAYDNIVKQLTAQQQALSTKGIPYASTFGGPTETIQDMAKRLAAMGISDIRDFGMKYEVPVEKVYETIEQSEGPALTFDTGKYRTATGVITRPDGESEYTYRELTPDEVENLQLKGKMMYLPVEKQEDLQNSPAVNTIYYNKKTGEQLNPRKFGGKGGDVWASSGSGDGFTDYRVMYTKDGIPVFIPDKQLSGMKEFITEDLSGILGVLRFIPGAQIPVMLAQAAAAAYMGAKPEDILKQAATTYLASNIGKLGDKFLPELGFDLPTSDLGKLAMNAGYSGLASLIQGGDLEDALRSAGLSAAGSGISGLLPKGGDFDYSKIIQAAAPALAKGKLTNADIFRILSSLAKPAQPAKRGR